MTEIILVNGFGQYVKSAKYNGRCTDISPLEPIKHLDFCYTDFMSLAKIFNTQDQKTEDILIYGDFKRINLVDSIQEQINIYMSKLWLLNDLEKSRVGFTHNMKNCHFWLNCEVEYIQIKNLKGNQLLERLKGMNKNLSLVHMSQVKVKTAKNIYFHRKGLVIDKYHQQIVNSAEQYCINGQGDKVYHSNNIFN